MPSGQGNGKAYAFVVIRVYPHQTDPGFGLSRSRIEYVHMILL